MRKIINNLVYIFFVIPFTMLGQDTNFNYIKTTTYTQPGSNEVSGRSTLTYYDGMGRPIQVIQGKASPNFKDIITHYEYDEYNRAKKSYLPYESVTNNFQYDTNARVNTLAFYNSETYEYTPNPYSENFYEPSPLNRVFKNAAPGSDWIGKENYDDNSDRSVKYDFKSNMQNEVKLFKIKFQDDNTEKPKLFYGGYYAQNQLYKSVSKDENWSVGSGKAHTTEQFTDKEGNLILKRTYTTVPSYENPAIMQDVPHDTYYVYDEFSNLTYVIPPLASDNIIEETKLISPVSVNFPWTKLVKVDASLADEFERNLDDYSNENILNLDLLNRYGGQGGFTIYEDNEEIVLNINISSLEPMPYRNGVIADLREFGNFPDRELGRLRGNGYEYIFLVRGNAITVSGAGLVPSTVTTINGGAKLLYNFNHSWANMADSSDGDLRDYLSKLDGYSNSEILTISLPNEYGAVGGANVVFTESDNFTLSVNINASLRPLSLKSGALFTLDVERPIPDATLGTISGDGYEYTFSVTNNILHVIGEGEFTSLTFYGNFGKIYGSAINEDAARLCYIYHYDYRNRLIEKHIPDNGWTHIVYDKKDRPVLTQDENLRNTGRWLFTKYDVYDRAVITGEVAETLSRGLLQSQYNSGTKQTGNEVRTSINEFMVHNGVKIHYTSNIFPQSAKIYSVNYFDNDIFDTKLNVLDISGYGSLKTPVYNTLTSRLTGLNTGGLVRVLDSNSDPSDDKWITIKNDYDEKGREVRNWNFNDYLSSWTLTESKIDFIGKTIEKKTQHKLGSESKITIFDLFTYDHADRPIKHSQVVGESITASRQLIAWNKYDNLGNNIIQKKVGNLTANNPYEQQSGLQTVNYKYNVRGWLMAINDTYEDMTGSDNLFAFSIGYSNLFNGNISSTAWRSKLDNQRKTYRYDYDALNRLTSAVFKNSSNNNQRFDESGIKYDKNGNILSLSRLGYRQYGQYDKIDDLVYAYKPWSNQLLNVSDNGTEQGFKDGLNGENDYDYDLSGNMIQDLNKAIDAGKIVYNHLNLPTEIIQNNSRIVYTYDALGARIQKRVYFDGNETVTSYSNGFVYKDHKFEYYPHAEGYLQKDNNDVVSYVYQYKDHLGNIRLTYMDSNLDGTIGVDEITESADYYPFGLQHGGNEVTSTNLAHKIKYQGQERQDELGLNWDSFKWRNYDYAIGRFFNVDPLAAEYPYNSVYAFQENKMGMGRELEGLELAPFEFFLFSENPPVTQPLMNAAKVGTEIAAESSEAIEVHHIIPRALKNNEVVKNAREEGFKFEGAENKMPLPKFSKSSGTGRHGPHPEYNKGMNEAMKKPEGMSAVEFLREVVSQTKELIQSKPDTKINDIFKTKVIIENTGVPKPELPRRITPKKEEKLKPSISVEGVTFS